MQSMVDISMYMSLCIVVGTMMVSDSLFSESCQRSFWVLRCLSRVVEGCFTTCAQTAGWWHVSVQCRFDCPARREKSGVCLRNQVSLGGGGEGGLSADDVMDDTAASVQEPLHAADSSENPRREESRVEAFGDFPLPWSFTP